MTKTREDAWKLLNRHTKNPNLIKHARAVEAAMRYYARHFNEDEELWGMSGLLHDFDYEQFPTLDEHPYKGQEILKVEGYSDDVQEIIMGHAPHTGTARDTRAKQVIFAVDELSGFIVAVALSRPNKTLAEVDVASVRKKMKQKAFAAKVSREDIQQGAQELGLSLDEHIGYVLKALQSIAKELRL